MNFNEFLDYIQEHILEAMPIDYDDSIVDVQEVYKNNDIALHGLIIRDPTSKIAPTIYLENFFEDYQQGEDINTVMNKIVNVRLGRESDKATDILYKEVMEIINHYSLAKQHLGFRLCDPELNELNMQNYVFSMEGDFAALYRLWLPIEDGIASVVIRPSFLKKWGIDLETLRKDAFESAMKMQPVLNSMWDIMNGMAGGIDEVPNLLGQALDKSGWGGQIPMYVLTNAHKRDGASMILQKEIQEELGLMFGCNYYVLPSSVHEVILIPDKQEDGEAAWEFTEMVREVNRTEVSSDEILSDKVQYYDCNEGKLLNAIQYKIAHEKTLEERTMLPGLVLA